MDGEILFYPDDDTYTINNAVVNQAMNEAGTFECDVPATNPLYDLINERQSEILITKDRKEIFYGEVREVTTKIKFIKHIYAVGELAYLFDSIQPQKEYRCEPEKMFKELINEHNKQVNDERKKFVPGDFTVTDPNNMIYRFTNYNDTLTCLREKICDSLNGYLRIRKKDGIRYLDCVPLTRYGKVCEQDIEFGDNLLDYAAKSSGESIATAVIPLGARLEEQVVKGLDAYTTIEKSTKKPPDGITHDAGTDYVYNKEAIKRFGMIKVVKKWDDVTEADNLLTKAGNWLNTVQWADLSIELNALDLAALDSDYDTFELGDTIHATAIPLGMQRTAFNVMKKKTYLQNQSKNYISLGNTVKKSYTKQASKAINEIEDMIPESSSLLEDAKERAIQLLNGADGGVVLHEFDDKGRIKNIIITDNVDLDKAQNRWIWNINGLGYQSKGEDGKWSKVSTAITYDGHIVANAITSGYMSADYLKGGILDIGGKEYYSNGQKNPCFEGYVRVRNEKHNEILRIDREGLHVGSKYLIDWTSINSTKAKEDITKMINDWTLAKDGKAIFKTSIGNSWLRTTTVIAQNLVASLLWKNDSNYVNFGSENRTFGDGTKHYLPYWINIDNGKDCFRIDNIARTSAKRFIATDDGDPDSSNRIEFTHSGLGIVRGGKLKTIDADRLYELVFGNSPDGTPILQQLYAWAKGQPDPFKPK